MRNLDEKPKKIFGIHTARLVEQGVNIRDTNLQEAYREAKKNYSPEQLELIIREFEFKNSRGHLYRPNGYLNSSLQKGWAVNKGGSL